MNIHDPSFARAAPCNVEAEQALLGAILVNNAALDRVSAFLEPEHFSEKPHREIYKAASDFIRNGKQATPISLKTFLPDFDGLRLDGEPATMLQYLIRLASVAAVPKSVVDYGRLIQELASRRHVTVFMEDAIDRLYSPGDLDMRAELSSLSDEATKALAELQEAEGGRDIGDRYLDSLTAARQRKEVSGVPIGIPEVARVLSDSHFEPGNLYGLLSSSGEGKTSLTLQLIGSALEKGHPVLVLSYDQSAEQITRQMVAQRHQIDVRRQRAGDLSEKEWERAVDFAGWVSRSAFDVVKCTDHGAGQLVSFARTFLKRKGNGKPPLVVVDHIGAIRPEDRKADEGTKAKDINKILKAGAEITQSAWLVLNQRNSGGISRPNPRPIGRDLFGGDPAKQAYDAIFYVYRFKKFWEDAKAVASRASDWTTIDKVFPEDVRLRGVDLAEIGSIKVRFGDPNIKETLIFDARFTRYRPVDEPAHDLIQQDELGI